jgi:prophage antirepressor-like protein
MTTEVIPFRFESESSTVRVVEIDGEPWFVVKDVLSALEYAEDYNPSRAVDRVPDKWKGVHPLHTLGGQQDMVIFSEAGLYFFVGRSDKPKALPFQMWLAGEVLPSLRKRGFYGLVPIRERMRHHGTLLRVVKQLVGSRDAMERELLLQAATDITRILGLKMPDLSLLGKPANQTSMEI